MATPSRPEAASWDQSFTDLICPVGTIPGGLNAVNEPLTTPKGLAESMSHAAIAWLEGLDDEQQVPAWWGAPGGEHEAERRRWFYAPTDHGGLAFSAQFDWQQRRAMQLVASGLSPAGYALVSTIMGTENIL